MAYKIWEYYAYFILVLYLLAAVYYAITTIRDAMAGGTMSEVCEIRGVPKWVGCTLLIPSALVVGSMWLPVEMFMFILNYIKDRKNGPTGN